MVGCLMLCFLLGAAAALIGDWYADMFARAGAAAAPSRWIGALTGLAQLGLVLASGWDRAIEGQWWWDRS